MSIGGEKGSGSSTEKTEPWDEQIPYLLKGFEETDRLYGGNTAGSEQGGAGGGYGGIVGDYYQGNTIADLSDHTKTAQDMVLQNAQTGQNRMAGVDDMIGRTVGGEFLNSNPFLDAMYNKQADQVKQNYQDAMVDTQSTFARGGRYGSGAHFDAEGRREGELMEGLGDLATDTYYQNYKDERGNQMDAAGLTPQLEEARYTGTDRLESTGEYMDQYLQDLTNADIDRWDYEQAKPYTALQRFMGLIQGNYGGTTSSKSKESNMGFSLNLL